VTGGAAEALRAERDVVLGVGARLADSDWQAPSGCPGWSVQDVFSHLGAVYWMVAGPASLPDVSGLPTERAQDAYVEARRTMTPAQVLADYEQVSLKAIEILAGLAGNHSLAPLGDLGTYPISVIPNSFCFDHYAHVRADLFAPRGPLAGEPPAASALQFGAALDWMEAALPQQCGPVLAELTAPAEIVITGTAGRSIHLGPDGAPEAQVTCGADEFIRWATQRATLAEAGASATGDEAVLSVISKIKVF
jgi:uncharacterized protein (TIGR03083 family)